MKVNKSNIQTMRWVDGKFEMIDQRILPNKFEYILYDSAQSVAEGIKTMVVRGAPAIGCAAAFGIALEALKLNKDNNTDYIENL
jgi:methylthioribose-1-phosphate isomerase